MRKTINIEKLDRHEVPTNRLQEIALLLVEILTIRADVDLCETIKNGSQESEDKDRRRMEALREVYKAFQAIPLRQEEWRHRLG